jgi:Lipocalin-like domain
MQNKVVGAWALESFLIENPQGETRNWGANTHGLLLYTDTGHMSVSINKDIENKSAVEAQNFFDSILFYSGTYASEGTTIRHKVTQASNPTRIGKEMLRSATLEGNLLTLISPPESFGRAILKWRKI